MNLPSDFSQRTHELLGDNDYRQLEDALQDEAPVSSVLIVPNVIER